MLMAVITSAQDFSFDEMTYSPQQTVFKLFAPNNAKCYVKVGKKKVNKKYVKKYKKIFTKKNAGKRVAVK